MKAIRKHKHVMITSAEREHTEATENEIQMKSQNN